MYFLSLWSRCILLNMQQAHAPYRTKWVNLKQDLHIYLHYMDLFYLVIKI